MGIGTGRQTMTKLRATWLAGMLALTGIACGGAALHKFVEEGSASHTTACRTAAAQHAAAVRQLDYLPPRLKAVKWAAELPEEADGMIKESELVSALLDGRAHFAFVQARGGVGKTELSKAIVAQTCSAIPAFRVDLKEAFSGTDASHGQNRIVKALSETLELQGGSEARKKLVDLLPDHRWILLLDSLDETQGDRSEILSAIADMRARHPQAVIVVFGRPAIFEPFYGLSGFDAVLELPPLDCGRARSSLVRLADDDVERDRMTSFIKTWNMESQSLIGQQCYYPYLSTYRDIQVVQRMAKTFNPDTEMGGLQANLTQVHEAVLAERLEKELAQMKWTGEQALQAVDAMVRNGAQAEGEWNLVFTINRCLGSLPGGDQPPNREVCEKIFQSVLFEKIGGTGEGTKNATEWKFGHQTVADLFVARWMDAELAKTPDRCDLLDAHVDMIGGKDIAGYLVGRPNGARCLAHVAHALCKVSGGFQKSHVTLLYKGLPLGAQRGLLVKAAKEQEASHGAEPCATQILGAL